MKPVSLQQIAGIVGGRLEGAGDVVVTEVSTDSRTMSPGALFVALKGENFDAHEFIDAGKLEAASALLVARSTASSLPQIVVADTRKALGDLARYCRRQFGGRLVAVTGSNGKTTVKEMCGAIMRTRGSTLMTQGNLNNDIGLPLTLFNLEEQDYAVVELGANHPGEIDYLTRIALPDAAAITHAGSAHLEGFGSVEGVAKAKGEIFAGLGPEGTAVINIDDRYRQIWLDLAQGRKILTFSLKADSDFSADWKPVAQGSEVSMRVCGQQIDFTLALPGVHNVMNALTAAALSYAVGFEAAQIREGLQAMRAVSGRLQWNPGRYQGMRILDDTYNANPTSLSAGLAVLAREPGEHWLVLGDMGELGPESQAMHEEAGRLARRAGVSRLFSFGQNSRYASEYFGEGGRHFSSEEELLAEIEKQWRGEGAILIKGSRAMRMERFVNALKQQDDAT